MTAASPLRVNIVLPPLHSERFSGGTLCILEHAHQLHRRGHTVTVVPTRPSQYPAWFRKEFGTLLHWPQAGAFSALKSLACTTVKWALNRNEQGKEAIRQDFVGLVRALPQLWTPEFEQAVQHHMLRRLIPDADITIATQYSTALPVYLFGRGRLGYFLQHHEVIFANDTPDPEQTFKIADMSYRLGMRMMANSPWLRERVRTTTAGAPDVLLSPNAIDHSIFNGQPKPLVGAGDRHVTLISYGGRHVEWKGFREMAEATAIARRELPDYTIDWHVYGGASLPPDNPVAPYTDLGFLQPRALADAYRAADILLSASWYESFPLFPAEAMACGLPVVTTQPGTEQYAIPDVTAEVVEARSPRSVADGLIRLIRDPAHRRRIATAGWEMSQGLTWDAAGDAMEANIRAIVAGHGTPE